MKTALLMMLLAFPFGALGQGNGGLPIPDSGNVTLPLDEYNKLLELAGKPPKKVDAAPVRWATQRADLKFQVTGDSASGTVELRGEVFTKGVTAVPLLAGMAVLDAQQKGTEVPLEKEGGTQSALIEGPGPFSITVIAAQPLNIEAGRASFNLPAPAAGTVHLTLAIPGDHTNVNINRGLITSRTSSVGQTTIEATLVPGQPVTIWWATRENVAPVTPREMRFLSDLKTLISVTESTLVVSVIADVTVLQGDPGRFEIDVPTGFEVTGASGASLESSDVNSGVLAINMNRANLRSHQFLITMERPINDTKVEAPLLSLRGSQRETGEVLVEGEGTMELTATESGGLKRMDLKETSPWLRSLARNSLQAAFRFHRQPSDKPGLSLAWVRFPDSNVLAAVAQQADVTTLVTSEGRSLTEVKLVLQNQAQPFLRVALPAGVSILSADVAGERVKPVQGADGNRVPLLRTGFRPSGPYEVSFVFMHAGAPFAKKGGSELALPKMDLPIGLLQWEIFLPEQYKVKDFGGEAIAAELMPMAATQDVATVAGGNDEQPETLTVPGYVNLDSLSPGQLGGFVLDSSGAVIPNAIVIVTALDARPISTRSDPAGRWLVANVPSGRVKVMIQSPGFTSWNDEIAYDAHRPSLHSATLQVGGTKSEVAVVSANESRAEKKESQRIERQARENAAAAANQASGNVQNLQRRVAGVLPIAVDVPRTGTSYRFVRPLVVDEETKVTFTYRTK